MKGMDLLGLHVKDKVTNVTGIVTSMSYDLYGCIQALIIPSAEIPNREDLRGWYDINRLEVLNKTPVLKLPDWATEEIGCECKPMM